MIVQPIRRFFSKDVCLLIVLLSVGIFLRFLFLDQKDLWYDEASTIPESKTAPFWLQNPPLPPLIESPSKIYWAPPVYLVFMKLWLWVKTNPPTLRVFHNLETTLRLPSVLFSIGSLFILYLLGKRMFDKTVALLALMILSLSPFHLWYAQEARSYSLAVFVSILSSYFLYSFLREGKKKHLYLFVFFSAASIYCNYFCFPLVVAQSMVLAGFSDSRWMRKVTAFLPLFLFLPWLPIFLKELLFIKQGFWIVRPSLMQLGVTVRNLLLGYNGVAIAYTVSVVLTVCTGIVSVKSIFKKDSDRKKVIFCLTLILVPPVAVFLFSYYGIPVYLDRGLIIITPYFYILLAWAILSVRRVFLRRIIIFCVIVLLLRSDRRYFFNSMYRPYAYGEHPGVYLKKPVRPLVRFLKGALGPDDFIVYGNHSLFFPLMAYFLFDKDLKIPLERVYDSFVILSDAQGINEDSRRAYATKMYRNNFFVPWETFQRKVNARSRLFFIGCTWSRNGELDVNSTRMKELLDRRFEKIRELDFDGVRLFVYKDRDSEKPGTVIHKVP